jgi:hypothetical protein
MKALAVFTIADVARRKVNKDLPLVVLACCAVIGTLWLRSSRSERMEDHETRIPAGGSQVRGAGEASAAGLPAGRVDGAETSERMAADRFARDLIARERPVLPAARRDAILMFSATDEEARQIEVIERANRDALAEMVKTIESEDDRYARLLELIDEERAALVALLGEERAALYSWLRAQEVEEEVLGLVGGLPEPEPARE